MPTFIHQQPPNMALRTEKWVLKVGGIISDTAYSSKGSTVNLKAEIDQCAAFRTLYERSKCGLPMAHSDEENLQTQMRLLANRALELADVVIATYTQCSSGLMKDIRFDHVIVDGSSGLSVPALMCAWRWDSPCTRFGDPNQRYLYMNGPPDMFHSIRNMDAFSRFLDQGHKYFLLTEQRRMRKGLINCVNEVSYNRSITNGQGTDVHLGCLAMRIKDFYSSEYPKLDHGSSDVMPPLFLNVDGFGLSQTRWHMDQ